MAQDDEAEARRNDEDAREKHRQRMLQARFSAIGIQFAVSIAIGALLGRWLDSKFGTDPILTLVGCILGTAAAFLDLYRLGKEQAKK